MTRTTPELPGSLSKLLTIPERRRLGTTYDLMCNRPIRGGSLEKSGFETVTLRPEAEILSPGHCGPDKCPSLKIHLRYVLREGRGTPRASG
ncbi:hypothetical protein AVEN_83573-1 [Araneus ventricosus]|uniref:Uncharacterized protein n=1 Tax=Araneus ventricosus TaxID=182803 RepID=A0A4Y2X3D1_ARAVE|nr:hypothetical protein AVEN_202597-1 [Araneus ventricosus]GBO43394.1 hypothetical protein AVEN_83573-1 [Araneus ventricosus]